MLKTIIIGLISILLLGIICFFKIGAKEDIDKYRK